MYVMYSHNYFLYFLSRSNLKHFSVRQIGKLYQTYRNLPILFPVIFDTIKTHCFVEIIYMFEY